MSAYTFFSFVEDEATKSVVLRLFRWMREVTGLNISLSEGHPVITHGSGKLREKAKKLMGASKAGLDCFFVTDLDAYPTPNDLGKSWFGIECLSELPKHFLFRISVREIESWIMADRESFASFLNVSPNLLAAEPDTLEDPKQFLFNLIRAKCQKRSYRDMLPLYGQHVGVAYNPMLSEFVSKHWIPENAAEHSPSLKRALQRIKEYFHPSP